MAGGCLVIQGPPGTGKTYTASQVITALLAAGKKVGVSSNSHKAVVNLLLACGEATGGQLQGIKVGGDSEGRLFTSNRNLRHVKSTRDGRGAYTAGVVGGRIHPFVIRAGMTRRKRGMADPLKAACVGQNKTSHNPSHQEKSRITDRKLLFMRFHLLDASRVRENWFWLSMIM